MRCDLLHFGKQMAGEEYGHAAAFGQASHGDQVDRLQRLVYSALRQAKESPMNFQVFTTGQMQVHGRGLD